MSATTDMGSSPCNYFCRFNDTQTLCLGCFRSKEELKNWTHLNDREKGELMSVAAKRMHSYIAVNLMRANFDFPIEEIQHEE